MPHYYWGSFFFFCSSFASPLAPCRLSKCLQKQKFPHLLLGCAAKARALPPLGTCCVRQATFAAQRRTKTLCELHHAHPHAHPEVALKIWRSLDSEMPAGRRPPQPLLTQAASQSVTSWGGGSVYILRKTPRRSLLWLFPAT